MLLKKILRGRFKIVDKIGGGGFGETYLAIDLDYVPQRQCVVKHFSPRNSHPEAVAIAKRLFKEEAKSLSSLGEHDRIPRLYAYIEETPEFYLVQEFISGHSLATEIEPGKKWSEAETVSFLQELLEILAVVHQDNKIHRDIKPANIMRRDDGKLFLIDFGAVKEIVTVDRNGNTNIRTSDLTVGIGTYYFMAPEQAQGKPEKCSDIYAVGKLAILALTGLSFIELDELPIDSDNFMKILARQQVKISSHLETVLRRMIQFEPKNRYPDAAAALTALTPQSSVVKRWLPFLGAIALLITALSGFYTFVNRERPLALNYSSLETSVREKNWQEANRETNQMLSSLIQETSIDELPCKPLERIDRLWIDNSDGRFGFTPQKQIYLDTGNKSNGYVESTYQEFGDLVGWRTFGHWSLFGDLVFNDRAPVGHLPTPSRESEDRPDLNWRERQKLLSKVDRCEI